MKPFGGLMGYDWTGKRTRRMKILRLAAIGVLASSFAAFVWQAMP
ncbi:hypothetical protein J2Z31_002761 [Sinorhizobium kostiense]|uniref:Transmembrane protein n=1 Tax=Sinorhizobium kostiense TaxID=76747 RepID=A0ABS4R027_9HYPH|nr:MULTISPECIES: hypothetical protein [Sinorhizobium/Ensifer group]MBP2236247.1 hypothetical protein [Sinorhizobium kostiense]